MMRMLRTTFSVLLLGSLLLACGCSQASSSAHSSGGTRSVEGILINSASNPIVGATITLTSTSSNIEAGAFVAKSVSAIATAQSDTTGYFILTGIAEGSYRITAEYQTLAGSRSSVSVQANKITDMGVLILKNTGEVYGSVSLQSTSNYSLATVALLGTSIVAITNPSGNYRMYNVPEGDYDLIVTKLGYVTSELVPVSVSPNVVSTVDAIELSIDPLFQLQGPTGNTGAQGATGNIGTQGPTGNTYLVDGPSNFSATQSANTNDVVLSWTNPIDSFAGVMVRRSTTRFPLTIFDGDYVYSGADETVTDPDLTSGTTYNYSIWAADSMSNWSEVVTTSIKLAASQWLYAGTQSLGNITSVAGTHTHLDAYGTTLYLLYKSDSGDKKLTCKQFDGSSWSNTGQTDFSSSNPTYTAFSVSSEGVPYAAFTNADGKAQVMKCVGNYWQTVGTTNVSTGSAEYIDLDVYQGVPYIAYRDGNDFNRVTVMKYEQGMWQLVGIPGFTLTSAVSINIVVCDGAPFVAYVHSTSIGDVMKFSNGEWASIGSFGSDVNESLDFSVDAGVPYVSFSKTGSPKYATVRKFNGSSWEAVGASNASAASVYYLKHFVYNGVPYIAYQNPGYWDKITVRKLVDNTWTNITDPVSSDYINYAKGEYVSMYVLNGVIYISYKDIYNGSDNGVSVMKYE